MRRSPAALFASLSLLAAYAGCVGGATPYPPSATDRLDGGVGEAAADAGAASFDAAAPPPGTDGGGDLAADADAADADVTDADTADADTADADTADADAADAFRPDPDGGPERLPREP